MVIFTKIEVGGTEFTEAERINVKSKVGESNASSNFTATFPNFDGRNSTSFSVGDTVDIFSDEDVNPAVTKIFTGTVETIQFKGRGTTERVTISGRDFTQRLMDATVIPSVFNNSEVSTIVTSIIANEVVDITTTNVDVTSTTLTHIAFNHTPVFDACKQLAELSGFTFFVDTDKDLHFELRGATSSGVTLDSTNILSSDFKKDDMELYNQIFVYGDRVFVGWDNTFTADGGSVFNLDFQPGDTRVFVGGSTTPKQGAIFEQITATPGSPTQYLIDFDGQRVIFISGTSAGDNIPISGTDTIVCEYNRSTPIVKFGQNNSSVAQFGPHAKIVVDKNIQDPRLATDIVKNTLERNSLPLLQGMIKLQGVTSLTAGNTILVNIPDENINNETFDILEVIYDFTTESRLSEEVLSVKVSRKIRDVTDTIKQMILDLRNIQAEDVLTSDVITRLEVGTGSFGFKVKEFSVATVDLGSSFVLNSPNFGDLGSGGDQVAPQTFLGDSRGAPVIQVSGGD